MLRFAMYLLAATLTMGSLPSLAQAQQHLPVKTLETLPDIAEASLKSVVNISSSKKVHRGGGNGSAPNHPFFNDPFFRHFFNNPNQNRRQREDVRRGLGSGVVVSADGYIITNNHVVAEADTIKVKFSNDKEYEAKLIGADPKSDVAVLKIEAKGLDYIKLGDSTKLRIGEAVIAIGNPFGLGGTVTMGIVSAKGRSIGITDYEDFIQTDAAINPGNSGGALVNLKGELIGINTAIFSRSGGNQGIGFAIPINMADSIMKSLIKHGKVARGFLGVTIKQLDEDLKKAFNVESGVLVEDALPDSPAERAGLESGDVITTVDGVAVDSVSKLRNVIAGKGPDASVKIDIVRENRKKSVEVKLTNLPNEPSTTLNDNNPLQGLAVQTLDKEMQEQLKEPGHIKGVIVTEVQPGSKADANGLKVYDIVMAVNRKRIATKDEFMKMITGAEGDLLLQVRRQGRSLFLVVKP